MLTFLFVAEPQGPIPERISSVLVSMEMVLRFCKPAWETRSSTQGASSPLVTQNLSCASLNRSSQGRRAACPGMAQPPTSLMVPLTALSSSVTSSVGGLPTAGVTRSTRPGHSKHGCPRKEGQREEAQGTLN